MQILNKFIVFEILKKDYETKMLWFDDAAGAFYAIASILPG
jgi:hypothetical protein